MLVTSAIKIISNEFGDCLQKLVGGLGKDQDKRPRDLAKGLIDTLKDTKATIPGGSIKYLTAMSGGRLRKDKTKKFAEM